MPHLVEVAREIVLQLSDLGSSHIAIIAMLERAGKTVPMTLTT
jgi:hypothetical protein